MIRCASPPTQSRSTSDSSLLLTAAVSSKRSARFSRSTSLRKMEGARSKGRARSGRGPDRVQWPSSPTCCMPPPVGRSRAAAPPPCRTSAKAANSKLPARRPASFGVPSCGSPLPRKDPCRRPKASSAGGKRPRPRSSPPPRARPRRRTAEGPRCGTSLDPCSSNQPEPDRTFRTKSCSPRGALARRRVLADAVRMARLPCAAAMQPRPAHGMSQPLPHVFRDGVGCRPGVQPAVATPPSLSHPSATLERTCRPTWRTRGVGRAGRSPVRCCAPVAAALARLDAGCALRWDVRPGGGFGRGGCSGRAGWLTRRRRCLKQPAEGEPVPATVRGAIVGGRAGPRESVREGCGRGARRGRAATAAVAGANGAGLPTRNFCTALLS
eukprot:360207-Chlamydomonas_euryale.AAC.9